MKNSVRNGRTHNIYKMVVIEKLSYCFNQIFERTDGYNVCYVVCHIYILFNFEVEKDWTVPKISRNQPSRRYRMQSKLQ